MRYEKTATVGRDLPWRWRDSILWGMRFLLLLSLLLSSSLSAVTLARIDCGGSGDSVWSADMLYSGGFRWGAANQPAMGAQAIPYSSLRYGSFSYALQFAPGSFQVTLKFLEPSATAAAGSRVFDVTVNGVTVFSGLDLFSSAGALKPFDLSFPVTATADGKILIVLKPTKGNAVLSGIQVDSIDAPPPSAAVRWLCADGVDQGGAGVGSMMPGVFTRVSCENMTDAPVKIIKLRCRADGAGGTVDLLAAGANGLVSVLPDGVVAICLPGGAETTVGASYPAGTVLTWAFRVNDSDDPAVKIATYLWVTVVLEQGG